MSAADIVAAARKFADGLDVSLTEAGNARIHITRLADTIEQLITDLDARFEHSDHQSAKYYQRWRDAEKHARMRASESADLERERDELAAVVERAQHAGQMTGYSHHKEPVMQALDAAPADALREHDRQVAERAWDEGFTRGFYAGQSYPDGADASEPDIDNPYRKDQENNNA